MLNGLCYVVLFGTILVAAELPAIFSAVTIDVYTTFTVTALRKQYHFYRSLHLPSATSTTTSVVLRMNAETILKPSTYLLVGSGRRDHSSFGR